MLPSLYRKHHPAEVEAQEAGVLRAESARTDSGEGGEDGTVLTGLNGLESEGGDGTAPDDGDKEDVDREDSSDHHESLVIAEDTEEEEEEEDDSHLQVEKDS